MTRRERVLNAVNFKPTDKLPRDLGGMASTGISCFAYEKLVKYLGLPFRYVKVWDTGQMLALPDLDVLDALDCDAVMLSTDGITNAFEQPHLWKPYNFNGRLQSGAVVCPQDFEIKPDGAILQRGVMKMPPESYVFDWPPAEFNLDFEPRKENFADVEARLESTMPNQERLRGLEKTCKRIRNESDRALFFSGCQSDLHLRGGMVNFGMLCLTEPDYVHEINELVTKLSIKRLRLYLQAVGAYADIIMTACEDFGTQNSTIISPKNFDELFKPYFARVNAAVRKDCPKIKTFMHCCGAIYDIMDSVIEMGIDILNPVQWCGGGQGYQKWKDKARGRLALWGGGVNSQATLPLGSPDDINREVKQVCRYFSKDSGYVFCCIHNILAEIPPEKAVAMYKAASEYNL